MSKTEINSYDVEGKMKKLLITAIAVAILIGSALAKESVRAATSQAVVFNDIKGHWGESAIVDAVQKGYVDGYPDGSFKPDAKVTRAEFIKMVDTALHVSISNARSGDAWYVPYINAAVNAGFHQWSDFTSGDWNTPMTREEMARIAVRAATGDKNTDDKKWMYLATKAGLITGMDDTGTLGEDQTTTRAQSVTIIERILSIKGGQTLPSDKHAVSRAEVAWHGTNIYTMLPRYFSTKFQDRFDISKAQWDSSDGNYHEELVSYIAVDLDDPNDPFRNEIEGIKYIYPTYQDGVKGGRVDVAPKGAYAVFSKVKQVIKGQYPTSLFVDYGGSVSMSQIVPNDAVGNKRADWMQYYSAQESTNKIYYSKGSDLNTLSQWHIDKGLNPYYAKQFPSSGGTFYWISAQAIPKGDLFSYEDTNTVLRYTPNIAYMNNYGPKTFIVLLNGVADYTVTNP
jgi:hypothetical protein